MSTFLDLHVLQTVPPSNVNRDDTGSPKTAMYGGVRRARVSSQAWKRAMRQAFPSLLDADDLGDRTKRVVKLVADEITAQAPELEDQAVALAEELWTALKVVKPSAAKPKKGQDAGPAQAGYLLFLSRHQVRNLAELVVDTQRAGGVVDPKEAKRRANTAHSVDMALFGRMVADMTDINVDACAQVAHALSVHAVDNEFDYFTAVDDKAPDDNAGAGMIGTVEFNSSTLYRYATLNVEALRTALGDDEVAARAVTAFITAFITSMPTGKQNTFANRTLPDAVLVQLRTTQPVNLVGAFETAVEAGSGSGRIAEAARRLAAHSADLDRAFGSTPRGSWVVAVGQARESLAAAGQDIDLAGLLERVAGAVAVPQPA